MNVFYFNGILYEGVIQKVYVICSEYVCVVCKFGFFGMIELFFEIVEYKEFEFEYDIDFEIDIDLIMKVLVFQIEVERQGLLYVGFIVRDVKEDEKVKLCEENVEVCVQNVFNELFDENVLDLVNGDNKDNIS